MSSALTLHHEINRHVDVATTAGARLFRYVYRPDTPPNESPRPYLHPLYSLAGDTLTNFRPNDHPWHHALSLTLTSVNGVNFWGGPSHRAADGYRWRGDHGVQVHRSWTKLSAERCDEIVEWTQGDSGRVLLEERRGLETQLHSDGWSLRWSSELRNETSEAVEFANYHSLGGMAGSHYTGLQFRGARELLDDHGDISLGLRAEGGLEGELAVHGAEARWMEWSCQHDGSLRRTRIRFENLTGPLPWFVRAKSPLLAFAFHRERAQSLAAGATFRLDHQLTFTNA